MTASAPIDARDEWGYTPLLWAIDHCHTKIVLLLLACGVDTSARPKGAKNSERNVIYRAKARNDERVLDVLADLNLLAPTV